MLLTSPASIISHAPFSFSVDTAQVVFISPSNILSGRSPVLFVPDGVNLTIGISLNISFLTECVITTVFLASIHPTVEPKLSDINLTGTTNLPLIIVAGTSKI